MWIFTPAIIDATPLRIIQRWMKWHKIKLFLTILYPFQHPDEYQIILDSSTGSNGEKRLGATFIPRFFKYFPDLQLTALNCLLDLCEDEDANVSNMHISVNTEVIFKSSGLWLVNLPWIIML